MKTYLGIFLITLMAIIFIDTIPAHAKVLQEGQVSNDYYWQLIERSDGSTRWLCRKEGDSRLQKHQACNDANAVRPQ